MIFSFLKSKKQINHEDWENGFVLWEVNYIYVVLTFLQLCCKQKMNNKVES